MMVNLPCQPDWIQSHLGDTSLRVCVHTRTHMYMSGVSVRVCVCVCGFWRGLTEEEEEEEERSTLMWVALSHRWDPGLKGKESASSAPSSNPVLPMADTMRPSAAHSAAWPSPP